MEKPETVKPVLTVMPISLIGRALISPVAVTSSVVALPGVTELGRAVCLIPI